jgi:hypothetical protein
MPEISAPVLPANSLKAGSRIGAPGVLTALAVVPLLAWAAFTPAFRNPDGSLATVYSAAIAAGAAVILLAAAIGARWFACAAWAALALAGSAAALQLVNAGTGIHYQHYAIDRLLDPDRAPFLVFVLLQALLVGAGLRARFHGRAGRLLEKFRIWQLAAMVAVISATAAAVSRDARFYAADLVFGAAIQIVNVANIVLVAACAPSELLERVRQAVSRWFGEADADPCRPEPGGVDRFCVATAVAVTLVSSLLSWFVYQNHPHIPDEVSYLYQARTFAAGKVALPAPPAPAGFDVDLMTYEKDRWFSPVPPGWPAVLTLGELAGAPWLVDPVLGGLCIILAYLLLREICSRRTARFCIILLATSPWFLFMCMNFMTHTVSLLWALAAGLGVARSRRTGKIGWACLAGVAVGMGTLIRPLDGMIVAAVAGAWAIGIGGRRLRFPSLATLAAAAAMVSALAMPFNRALTGDPGRPPIMAYTDKYYGSGSNAYGFGPNRGLGWQLDPYPGHTFGESLINDNLNMFSVNIELLGWATGSLILIAALGFGGGMRRLDWAMLAVILVVLAAYTPYWYSGGPDFGARYWYLILLPAILLSVRGMQFLEARLGSGSWRAHPARVTLAVFVLCAVCVIDYLPWRSIDKYRHYLGMWPDIRQIAVQRHFTDDLVLVRGERHPDYASAAIYNPLDLTARKPLFAWDRNAEARKQVLAAYPDRRIWLVDGPSITKRGFAVVAGPLSAAEVNARTK